MYLLETDIVAQLAVEPRDAESQATALWADDSNTSDLYISVITLQELESAVLAVETDEPSRGAALRAWLTTQLLPTFEGRILPIDTSVAQKSAKIMRTDPASVRYGLIAATAAVHQLTVVTRVTEAYQGYRVKTYDPSHFAG